MPVKLMITADLQQSIGRWGNLVRVVEQERPRFVLVAGDLLPKGGGEAPRREPGNDGGHANQERTACWAPCRFDHQLVVGARDGLPTSRMKGVASGIIAIQYSNGWSVENGWSD